ncbi:MAG: transcriptional repressor LexA [Xanthomonadales bacterium]|nr:transcriptional repressor LexA [Gammaproteobacteria bacterium]MBT8057492.1 transcriptional repressor LexA [Gammaproteobacteria bacterium]NNJ80428.1 transcriptional repressor LexA [Xanthomonadales bacterium]NNL03713.1 transcriptional repressor LexA [Xanthomonadales bacterium]
MITETLTKRQREVLSFISEFIEKHKFPPTRSELSKHFGFRSPNAAESHLRALEKKAVIGIERGVSRGITLLPLAMTEVPGTANTPLPLVGRVAAGSPVLAQENIEDEYRVDPTLFSARPHYLLRVTGMSMRGAGILDGDLLAVHRTPEARNGQIVVARLDDEVTVKRFRQEGSRVELLPENPDFDPIEVDLRQQELAIEGLGVGVIRPTL